MRLTGGSTNSLAPELGVSEKTAPPALSRDSKTGCAVAPNANSIAAIKLKIFMLNLPFSLQEHYCSYPHQRFTGNMPMIHHSRLPGHGSVLRQQLLQTSSV